MKHIHRRDSFRLMKIVVVTKHGTNVKSYDNLIDVPKKVGNGNSLSYSGREMTSLKGGPVEISGDFDCSYNELKNLEGGPSKVGRSYKCSDNKLVTLKSCPEKLTGYFSCFSNQLKSLKYGPIQVGDFYDCSDNKLESLVGAPTTVDGSFICHTNKLKNLVGCPEEITNSLDCKDNPLLESLEGLPKKVNSIMLPKHIDLTVGDLYTVQGVLREEKEFETMLKTRPAIAKYIVDLCSKKFKAKYKSTFDNINQFDFFGDD